MNDTPIDLDKHRGMAAQKATDIRRVLADVEASAKVLRDRQGVVEIQLLTVPATSWPKAAAKAQYLLKYAAASLPLIRITAAWSRRYLRTLPDSRTRAERKQPFAS